MKKCPTCNRTFTDDALSFCLEDGSPLLSVGAGTEPPPYDLGATVQYSPARDTNPPPPAAYQPPQFPGQQVQPPSWTPMPPVGGMQAQPPPKQSKAIYWILGGVAALVVVGVGGIILVLMLVGMPSSNTNNANSLSNNSNSNSNASTNTNANSANKNSNSSTSKNYQLQEDFSNTSTWWSSSNEFGTAEYVNGEYQLSGITNGGYVVIYGPNKDAYHTENATTRVTARSVTGTSPLLGYGLTVLGGLKNGSLEDYAFLVRTDENPAFRVVLHQAGKETPLVNWTTSSLIRTGSSTNQLEVRANGDQLSFYINGQYATSVTDSVPYKNGLVGFYSSDTEPIDFDDLEIFR